jgi:NitT/TauT family transport system substrate-binding protein
MTRLNLMVYRHSAFYSPLIAGIAEGFFAAEGFEPTYTVMPATSSVGAMIASGAIDVSQTAVSAGWDFLEKGERPPFLSFAQINRRDGFLIVSRQPQTDFRWSMLGTGRMMFAHGRQPEAMLAYALHKRKVDFAGIRHNGINAGAPDASIAAFRRGEGDWYHEQGPYPQQLEFEGKAHFCASVDEAIGPVAFSSLAASPAWLATADAPKFTRAYAKARRWVHRSAPSTVAAAMQSFFPGIAPESLTNSIDYYQSLDCWGGSIAIDPKHYEKALDVFEFSKLVSRRHSLESVAVRPPA